jgi:hypothetical protein
MLMSALVAVVTRAGADPGVDARALIERMRGRERRGRERRGRERRGRR